VAGRAAVAGRKRPAGALRPGHLDVRVPKRVPIGAGQGRPVHHVIVHTFYARHGHSGAAGQSVTCPGAPASLRSGHDDRPATPVPVLRALGVAAGGLSLINIVAISRSRRSTVLAGTVATSAPRSRRRRLAKLLGYPYRRRSAQTKGRRKFMGITTSLATRPFRVRTGRQARLRELPTMPLAESCRRIPRADPPPS
jgi:hypothetical protein